MFGPFKKLFRFPRLRKRQDQPADRVDDQPNPHNTNPVPPPPPEPSRSADAERSKLLCEDFLGLASKLRPSFPPTCSWLGPTDLQDILEPPVDGGRFANVWRASLEGRAVAVKSYRCYVCFDCDRVRMRFWKEARAYNLLSHRNIVPFRGAYSTRKHPFSLVFDFMEQLNLSEYLRNRPDANKSELVTGIARGLHHMHDLGVVHGNLEIMNILVDSEDTPRIAGLGSASVHSKSSLVPWMDDTPELSRCSAPELLNPERFGLSGPQTTKESDIYSLGVLIYHIFAGSRPFSNLTENAAIYLMLDGSRPPRPNNPELSDSVWDMINGCWAQIPSERITIADVVAVLEKELQLTR